MMSRAKCMFCESISWIILLTMRPTTRTSTFRPREAAMTAAWLMPNSMSALRFNLLITALPTAPMTPMRSGLKSLINSVIFVRSVVLEPPCRMLGSLTIRILPCFSLTLPFSSFRPMSSPGSALFVAMPMASTSELVTGTV